jgi:hypothetical protein
MKAILAILGVLSISCATTSTQQKQFEFNPSIISCNAGSPTKVNVDIYTRVDQQIVTLSWLCKEESEDPVRYMLGRYNLEW